MAPNGVCHGAQVLQPRERVAATRVFVQRGHKGLQVVTDVHGHLGAGKHAPHRPRQTRVAHFRNPAPTAVVNGNRQARLVHGARFFGKRAPREVDMAELGVRDATARRK
jgi:hypothetical protein